jgi:hypothetical protein
VAAKPQSHEKQTQRRRTRIHVAHRESATRQIEERDVQDRLPESALRAAIQQHCVSFDMFIAAHCMRFMAALEHPSFAAIPRAI